MPRPRTSDADDDARRKDARDAHRCEGPVEEWCFHCRHQKAYRDGLKREPEPKGETMDTTNDFLVGVGGTGNALAVLMPIQGMIPREKALRLAAYIVAMLDPLEADFPKVLEAILNT